MGVITAYGIKFPASQMLVDTENKTIMALDSWGKETIRFQGVFDLSDYTFDTDEVYVPSNDEI